VTVVAEERKGQPFSVRFSWRTDLYMEEEARRLKRSKSSIVEELAEEASRLRRFPDITFHGGGAIERRAHLVGTGFDVWEVCLLLDDYGSAEALVEDFPKLSAHHCRVADAYRRAYPDEIAALIAGNQRPLEEMEALYPWVDWGGAGSVPS
jgi:uncharacterized protein (DUF433 family)